MKYRIRAAALGAALAAALILGGLVPATAESSASPSAEATQIAAALGSRCVRAVFRQGRHKLINRCAICRMVQIQHRRPNNLPPAMNDFYLPPNGSIDLPYRGRGHTRVLHDTACENEDRQAKSAERRSQACVRMRPANNGLVLINVCTVCKKGIVERVFRDGKREQQTLAIGSKGYTVVAPNGARSARLVSEIPCR